MDQSKPKLEDCQRIPSAKQRKPRPFVVEYWFPRSGNVWRKWKGYPTLAIAEQAMDDLNRKHASIDWRFRLRPTP